jgi:hypothetical protein
MAYQAPFRAAADERRQADIRERTDPFLKSLPPDIREFHRSRARNSPLYRRISEIGLFDGTDRALSRQGVAVLQDAMASSDDDQASLIADSRWSE